MEPEWRTDIRPGHYTKVIRVGNATVRVHRPILDDKERARREQQVMDTLRVFGKTMERSASV